MPGFGCRSRSPSSSFADFHILTFFLPVLEESLGGAFLEGIINSLLPPFSPLSLLVNRSQWANSTEGLCRKSAVVSHHQLSVKCYSTGKGHPHVARPALPRQRKSPLFSKEGELTVFPQFLPGITPALTCAMKDEQSPGQDEGSGAAYHEMWPGKARSAWPRWL